MIQLIHCSTTVNLALQEAITTEDGRNWWRTSFVYCLAACVGRVSRLGPRPAGPFGLANCCFTMVTFGWTSSYRNSSVTSEGSSTSI